MCQCTIGVPARTFEREYRRPTGDEVLNYGGIFITLTKCTYLCPYGLLVECTKVRLVEHEAT